jgi:hypothetical protein
MVTSGMDGAASGEAGVMKVPRRKPWLEHLQRHRDFTSVILIVELCREGAVR